jgi:hypothetical protein
VILRFFEVEVLPDTTVGLGVVKIVCGIIVEIPETFAANPYPFTV